MTTRVLFVCTGNICRSPIAEVQFEAMGLADVSVSSAGVLFDDREASDGAVEWAKRNDLDLSGHRSRSITRAMLSEQDVIIAMEPRHVREVVAMHDAAWHCTFTLRELAAAAVRAGPRGAGESLGAYLARLSIGRKRADLMIDAEALSIADPYQQSAQVYDRTGYAIAEALTQVTASLWPMSSSEFRAGSV